MFTKPGQQLAFKDYDKYVEIMRLSGRIHDFFPVLPKMPVVREQMLIKIINILYSLSTADSALVFSY